MIRQMRTLRCLIIAVSMVAGLAAQKVLTPEILNTLGRVGSLSLAPDGKHLLFTVSTPDLAANKGTTELFLLNLTEAGKRPAKVGAGSSPCWLSGGVEFAWQTEGVIKIRHLYEDGPDRTIQLDGPVVAVPHGQHLRSRSRSC